MMDNVSEEFDGHKYNNKYLYIYSYILVSTFVLSSTQNTFQLLCKASTSVYRLSTKPHPHRAVIALATSNKTFCFWPRTVEADFLFNFQSEISALSPFLTSGRKWDVSERGKEWWALWNADAVQMFAGRCARREKIGRWPVKSGNNELSMLDNDTNLVLFCLITPWKWHRGVAVETEGRGGRGRK